MHKNILIYYHYWPTFGDVTILVNGHVPREGEHSYLIALSDIRSIML